MPANKTLNALEKVTVPGNSTSQTLLSLMAGSAYDAGMVRLSLQNVGGYVCYISMSGAADTDSAELMANGGGQTFRLSPAEAASIQVMAATATRLNVQQEGKEA